MLRRISAGEWIIIGLLLVVLGAIVMPSALVRLLGAGAVVVGLGIAGKSK